MNAQDLQDYFRSLNGGWLDPAKTVDTFKAGDPKTEITGIAVGWMSYRWALEKALDQGCNVFVTHEPTYFDHRDSDPRYFGIEQAAAKREFIEKSRIVIIRCHDLWDQFPKEGIPDSWAAFLGYSAPLVSDGYFRVYDVTGQVSGDVARRVAQRVRALGQPDVALFGPCDKAVMRLALGTGAITPFFKFVHDYKADVAICTDDGMAGWQSGALAIDCGIPLIRVNHAVSEEPGMVNLARHLAQRFPEVPVRHVPQGCMYSAIGA